MVRDIMLPLGAIGDRLPDSLMSAINWKEISLEPNSPLVRAAVRKDLESRRRPRCFDKRELVRRFVLGHSVLDVGVVAHSLEESEADHWLHGQIKGWARELVGVDILEAECAKLRARGYDVRSVDAAGEGNLGLRFERVVLGDVIEHVDNAVKLMKFAGRHLTPGGFVLVTTPNPWYLAHIYETICFGAHVGNVDHVSWIAPANVREVGYRAGLELLEYQHIQVPAGCGGWKLRILHCLRDLMMPEGEIFGHTYAYVFGANG